MGSRWVRACHKHMLASVYSVFSRRAKETCSFDTFSLFLSPPFFLSMTTVGLQLITAFQTDADISGNRGGERELKPWAAPETDAGPGANGAESARNSDPRDTITFGGPMNSTPWDQFETNERLFGAKTDYDEELYTTKLDRSTTGYKRREREADRLAQEIMSVSTSLRMGNLSQGAVVSRASCPKEKSFKFPLTSENLEQPPYRRGTQPGQSRRHKGRGGKVLWRRAQSQRLRAPWSTQAWCQAWQG